MRIAVLTFDGFNEIDSLVAAHILNRVDRRGWRAEITSPTETVTSMNGVVVHAQQPLEFAAAADAVVIGGGFSYVLPRREEDAYTQRTLGHVGPFLGHARGAAGAGR